MSLSAGRTGSGSQDDKRLEFGDAEYRWWPEALAEEARLVNRWAFLSPVTNYQTLSCMLARTTFEDAFELAAATRDHRLTWIQYLRGRGAFTSRVWFTDDPISQEPMITNPGAVSHDMLDADSAFMRARTAWAEEQMKRIDPQHRSLDVVGMPHFDVNEAQHDMGETLAAMLPGLLVLLLTLGLSILITFMRFDRDEPF